MLRREITIMANVQHPNLVRFIAAVMDEAVERGTDTPIIVSELMDMNLRDAYAQVNLTDHHVSIFCEVAYAPHYLHQHRPSIIHRDISAPNVLLKALPNGGYRAKVSDFGSANLVKQSKTAGAGAIVYCAPEMFPSEDFTVPPQPQTTNVDVFSYGVLLLEVTVQQMPTPESRYALLQRVKTQWNSVYELIVHCTKPLPTERPSMADILNKMNRYSC
jgi:serine/threonine protein kinase